MPLILLKRDQTLTVNNVNLGELAVDTVTGNVFTRAGTGLTTDLIIDIADPIRKLGYTPVNVSGDLMKGTLTLVEGNSARPPMKFQQGSTLAIPQANALEYDGARLYLTNSGAQRKIIAFTGENSAGTSTGWNPGINITYTGDIQGAFYLNGTEDLVIPLNLTPILPNAGKFGDGMNIPSFKVNNKGIITEITTEPIELDSDNVIEGNSNLYFNQARVRNSISVQGDLEYDVATGVIKYETPTLATVATTGSYDDLSDAPIVFESTVVAGASRAIASFDNNRVIAAKLLVSVLESSTSEVHATEAIVLNNGNASMISEYGILFSNEALGTLSTEVVGTRTNIMFNPTSNNNKVVSATMTINLRA